MFLFQTTLVVKAKDPEIKEGKTYIGNEQAIKVVMENLAYAQKRFQDVNKIDIVERIKRIKGPLEEMLKATDKPIDAVRWNELKSLTNGLANYAINAVYTEKKDIDYSLNAIEKKMADITATSVNAEKGGFYSRIKIGYTDNTGTYYYDADNVLGTAWARLGEMITTTGKIKEYFDPKVSGDQGLFKTAEQYIQNLKSLQAKVSILKGDIAASPIIGEKVNDIYFIVDKLNKLEAIVPDDMPSVFWHSKKELLKMIGANITEIDAAIKDVDAELKKTRSRMKGSEKTGKQETPEKREPEKIEKKKEKEEQKPNLNYGAVFGKNAPVPSPESVTGTTPEDVLNRYIYRRALEINPKFEGLTLTKERVDQNRDKAIEYMQSRGWLEADFDYKATEMSANELKLFDAYFTMLCGRGKVETDKLFNKLEKADDEAGRAEVVQANVLALLTVRKDAFWKGMFKEIVGDASEVQSEAARNRD